MLVKYILNEHGVVFGAAFDEAYQVQHTYAETENDAKKFMSSKYVQSRIGFTYQEVKRVLSEERRVLFSGTPCQVAGLYAYLGERPKGLITVDFICHGVPSRKVWKQYLEEISNGRTIQSVNFRDKRDGWIEYGVHINFTDGSCYHKKAGDDLYMKGFIQNLYLRPSCYDCKFRGFDRISDITLGDFWGADKYVQEMFDNKGMSVVMTHSKEGETLMNEIKNGLEIKETSSEIIKIVNPSVIYSEKFSYKRKMFFEKKQTLIIPHLKKMTTGTHLKTILRKGKQIVKKGFGKIIRKD